MAPVSHAASGDPWGSTPFSDVGRGNSGSILDTCRCRRRWRLCSHDDVRLLTGAQALLDYLRRCSLFTSAPPSNKEAGPPPLVAGCFDWMRSQRGTQEGTLRQCDVVIKHALECLGTDRG